MRQRFEVDLVALALRRDEFSNQARRAADLPVVEAVRATPTGLPGTSTAAAAQDLSRRLGRSVSNFADIIEDLADRVGQSERTYHAADTEATNRLEEVLGPWAER